MSDGHYLQYRCPHCQGYLLVGKHSIKKDLERAAKARAERIEAAAKAVLDMHLEEVNNDRGEPYDLIANPGQFDDRVVALAKSLNS